ncbi:MAG: SAM-dependent methyltransferase [Crocinitomicaceae bacterium]|jgi:16S rRNA (cytidine1402-2'-O)-methyltransferase|nr:SAM-dependent methyltransferase [Crocinitomicaceae bacterium]MDP4760031.1 SAM-dependent methyltransferase [Crocinitomicaceae bacterium]
MAQLGNIYLIPNTLGGESVNDILPADVQKIATGLRYFAVEEIKSARRLLRKMDRSFPIDDSQFFIINKHTKESELMKILMILIKGENIGIISEAGCPGVADPGAELVALAHTQNIKIVPLVGPSSILLALMASGFSGQEFSFHGYLPRERKDRIKKLKDFEMDTKRNGKTHIFMDTPFRNMHVLEDMLNDLGDNTQLCIASNVTLLTEQIKTMSIKDWRENAYDIGKIPAIFLIGTAQ